MRRILFRAATALAIVLLVLNLIMIASIFSGAVEAAGERFSLNTKVVQGDEVVISDSVITDLSVASTLTVPANTRYVQIQAQGGNIRYRWGTAPTATTGGIVYAGDYFNVWASPDTIQLIEESSADAYVAFIR